MISSSLHMFSSKLAHQLSCTTCGLLWDVFLYYLWFCLRRVKCDDVHSVKNIMIIIIIFIILEYVLPQNMVSSAYSVDVIYIIHEMRLVYFEICFLRLIQMTSARIIGISFYGTHGPGKNNVVKPSSISFLKYYYLHHQ